MNVKPSKTIKWTSEQRAEHRAIRDAFRDWHPGPEELIASGAAARLGLNVIHSPAQDFLRQLSLSQPALSDFSALRVFHIDESQVRSLDDITLHKYQELKKWDYDHISFSNDNAGDTLED